LKSLYYTGQILLAIILSFNSWTISAKTTEDPAVSTVSVAAASDLKFALDELIIAFQKQNPKIVIKVSYASSGTLFAQLTHKAPFDIFLSADKSYPEKLLEQGLAVKGSEFIYAIGRIVIWVKQGSGLDVQKQQINIFKDPKIQKIAIANPKHAPYGRVAKQALEHYKIYDQLSSKLVFGENIAQTAQFVESGSADIGIISFSLAGASPMKEQGVYWEIPQGAYTPLEQQGVVLEWAKEKKAVFIWKSFLLSDAARDIFTRHHFNLPKK
jgi:molybdate transport system substrate-binding protein